jgi:hypothetical protein
MTIVHHRVCLPRCDRLLYLREAVSYEHPDEAHDPLIPAGVVRPHQAEVGPHHALELGYHHVRGEGEREWVPRLQGAGTQTFPVG